MDYKSPISEQLPEIPLADEDEESCEVAGHELTTGEEPVQDAGDDDSASSDEEGTPQHDDRLQDDGSNSVDSFSFQNDEGTLDEVEEKARLIAQILELQNTLDDLAQKVDNVKEENLKLKSENQVLGQYIENLMAASNIFQSTSQAPKRKTSKPDKTKPR